MTDYLLGHPSLVEGSRVLELGAGAGLPSVICALSGARRVVITDYPDHELIENIQWNVDHNVLDAPMGLVEVGVSLFGGEGRVLPDDAYADAEECV